MSCKKCEQVQGYSGLSGAFYYLRIDNANVQVSACEEHFKQLRDLVRLGMEASKVATNPEKTNK